MRICFAILLFALLGTQPARAISERGYEETYARDVAPFVQSGETFSFKTADGLELSAVRFVHPNPKGTILVVNGRTEFWLKYGEFFYDLYLRGYSLYSYDQRGQGLSPRLTDGNPQIGFIDHFGNYTKDLEAFIANVLVPEAGHTKLFLVAHSMGGATAADYLSRGKTPFSAAVLSSPMLSINTKPYAPIVAQAIAGAALGVGLGERYAPGMKNYDPDWSFEENDVTGSPERFRMSRSISAVFPETRLGGPSNAWVYRSLVATPKIVKKMKGIKTPVLLFQAMLDQIVTPAGQTKGCALTPACRLIKVPGSQHEVLMEKDAIRDPAIATIEAFFD